MIDALTGLPNRRALHRDIASRRGGEGEVALAIVDLDGFKQVNDHFGHATGDELIRAVAILITETCGDEAQCYRLSGDEFVLLADGPIAGNLIEGISRMIVDRLRKPVQLERRAIAVGASVGLSRSGGEEAPASSELLRRADVAMFASKRGGKMRCTWYAQALDRNREARLDLDNELRAALAKGEFRVNYQPLVDARTGAIVAVESLLRWEREDGSQIGPNIFIPVAEESGLINAIGLWVLRTACRDARDWGDLNLSVNISAAQLRNPEFPILVGQVLEETGFPPERLELEVTETCLVLDPVVVGRSLDVIRQFGVSISLDDFGTGYASIGFLRQFRFEKLKLDRSLVVDAQEDDGSRAMMISSISLARAMKMGVTAEGVETQCQADMVRAAGADQIQGWLYYRAMPPEQIVALKDKFGSTRSDRSKVA
ncbi:hypothetical protein ELI_11240 [Erythrobacter litoralis HTCC2594]|uniref:Sensory box/GGDEF family protein n=2 Tax=Erythrobacter litoralis TaxID=39960 RepID=Q2N7K1_ERYLH|nr:hypothetical protein ELI_11240 [Erythrobacter litoralis HTCC2594]